MNYLRTLRRLISGHILALLSLSLHRARWLFVAFLGRTSGSHEMLVGVSRLGLAKTICSEFQVLYGNVYVIFSVGFVFILVY